MAPENALHEVVLPQVGEGVAVVAEDVAGEELDAILVADVVDAQHGVPRAARHAHLPPPLIPAQLWREVRKEQALAEPLMREEWGARP